MKKRDKELFEDLIKAIDMDTKKLLHNIDDKDYVVHKMLDFYIKTRHTILLDKAISELSILYTNRDTAGLPYGQYRLEYMGDHIFGDVPSVHIGDGQYLFRADVVHCIYVGIRPYTTEINMAKMASLVVGDILLSIKYNKLAGCGVHGKMPSRNVLNTVQVIINSMLDHYDNDNAYISYKDYEEYYDYDDECSVFSMYIDSKMNCRFVFGALLDSDTYNKYDIIDAIIRMRNPKDKDKDNKQVDNEDDSGDLSLVELSDMIGMGLFTEDAATNLKAQCEERLNNDTKLDMIRHSNNEIDEIAILMRANNSLSIGKLFTN